GPQAAAPLRDASGRLRVVVRPERPDREVDDPTPGDVTSAPSVAAAEDAGDVWAEPLYPTSPARIPNDPLFPSQPPFWIAPGSDGLRAAWEITTGPAFDSRRLPVVAVVDTGMEVAHPDLAANLWTNPGEQPGNGRDDDGNGYADDVHGVNVLTGGVPAEAGGHGTAVAGLLGARGNNGIGVSGTLWQARIMAVRVTRADGGGTTADLAAGIRYAARMGARVINVSMTTPTRTQVVDEAVRYAAKRDALVVASAGNESLNAERWPAASGDPHTLSVGSIDNGGRLAPFSNFGPSVQIMAPGVNLPTTSGARGFGDFSGTSASAPVVAGTAALLLSAQPQADVVQMRDVMLRTRGSTSGLRGSGGPLRAVRAMEAAAPVDVVESERRSAAVLELRVSVSRPSSSQRRFSIRWRLRNAPQRATSLRLVAHENTATGRVVGRETRRVSATSGSFALTRRKQRPGRRVRLAVVGSATTSSGIVIARSRVYVSVP
ncbi:MAG: S8 family serine peptidase, partial [Solirubrobacteraceae bacterium]|nr:S8 family serine peptidase [Solirubrobacteraceae bacterium]